MSVFFGRAVFLWMNVEPSMFMFACVCVWVCFYVFAAYIVALFDCVSGSFFMPLQRCNSTIMTNVSCAVRLAPPTDSDSRPTKQAYTLTPRRHSPQTRIFTNLFHFHSFLFQIILYSAQQNTIHLAHSSWNCH